MKYVQGPKKSIHLMYGLFQPGPDAYTLLPNSELIVARVAFRNNSSKYTINRKPSNFTEVTTLLRQRGIDLDHKRFLILQVCDLYTQKTSF